MSFCSGLASFLELHYSAILINTICSDDKCILLAPWWAGLNGFVPTLTPTDQIFLDIDPSKCNTYFRISSCLRQFCWNRGAPLTHSSRVCYNWSNRGRTWVPSPLQTSLIWTFSVILCIRTWAVWKRSLKVGLLLAAMSITSIVINGFLSESYMNSIEGAVLH